MLILDGSGGGGQLLRSSLGLALATGAPFRMTGIRGGRSRPGLLRQHLACVRAAAAVGRAEVDGDTLGSTTLTFRPRGLVPGEHAVAVGSAGSAMLVVQAVLPGLLVAEGPSRLVVEGGTHNDAAPPFDFFARSFLPAITRLGARVVATLERPGFYPAGGGRVVVEVEPAPLRPAEFVERGDVRVVRARAVVSGLPVSIAHRELRVVRERFPDAEIEAAEVPRPVGPGNVVTVEVACDGGTAVFTGFGERGVPAEDVATRACDDAAAWIAAGVPVCEHLADQLLVPMALAGGGRFRTTAPSPHTTTNAGVVAEFLSVSFEVGSGEVAIRRR